MLMLLTAPQHRCRVEGALFLEIVLFDRELGEVVVVERLPHDPLAAIGAGVAPATGVTIRASRCPCGCSVDCSIRSQSL